MRRREVHVARLDGSWIYNRLWDDGSNVLQFDSGGGFLTRDQIDRERWIIVDGWVKVTRPAWNG